jgi:hypothetical protein
LKTPLEELLDTFELMGCFEAGTGTILGFFAGKFAYGPAGSDLRDTAYALATLFY